MLNKLNKKTKSDIEPNQIMTFLYALETSIKVLNDINSKISPPF